MPHKFFHSPRIPDIKDPKLRHLFYQAELDVDNFNKANQYIYDIKNSVSILKKKIRIQEILKALQFFLEDYRQSYGEVSEKKKDFYKYIKKNSFIATYHDITYCLSSHNQEKEPELKALKKSLAAKRNNLTRSEKVRCEIVHRIKDNWKELTEKNNIYFIKKDDYITAVNLISEKAFSAK